MGVSILDYNSDVAMALTKEGKLLLMDILVQIAPSCMAVEMVEHVVKCADLAMIVVAKHKAAELVTYYTVDLVAAGPVVVLEMDELMHTAVDTVATHVAPEGLVAVGVLILTAGFAIIHGTTEKETHETAEFADAVMLHIMHVEASPAILAYMCEASEVIGLVAM